MSVSFNTIPSNIRVPLFYAELDNSMANSGTQDYKSLALGQMGADATAVANKPYLVTSTTMAKSLFGLASPLTRMLTKYFANNTAVTVWAVAVNDNDDGVAATGKISISGTASASGTLNLYIAGQRLQVAITSEDSADTIGAAIESALGSTEKEAQSNASTYPVIAGNAGGVVTLTARQKGEVGNVDVRLNYYTNSESTPAGLTVEITKMAGGITNPEIDEALASLGDEAFRYIGNPYTDTTSLNDIQDFLNSTTGRWSYQQQNYGCAFSFKDASLSSLVTFGSERNDEHMSISGLCNMPNPAYEVVGAYLGVASSSLSIDPARPLQTLALSGILAPNIEDRFIWSERNTLLNNGISTFTVINGYVCIERCISTYQKNAYKQSDDSYLDMNTLFNLAYILDALKSVITSKYGRHKLANDGTKYGEGQAIVTPKVIKAELINKYSDLEELGLVENADKFKSNLIVKRNSDNPSRVDVLYPPDLINQLRVLALLTQFRLQY